MTTQHAPSRPMSLGQGEGSHFHFLNQLATVKVSNASMSVVEFVAPRGFAPPLHRHDREDELFVMLSGDIMLFDGDHRARATAGASVWLPSGIPHTYLVESEAARIVTVTARDGSVADFDRMVTVLGDALPDTRLPAPEEIDPDEVARVCADHGIEILGPPPASV